jgi:hypothetical protein
MNPAQLAHEYRRLAVEAAVTLHTLAQYGLLDGMEITKDRAMAIMGELDAIRAKQREQEANEVMARC